ncbi:MAG: tRNA pseudouridine(38-40) synthase TruA [Thermoanaerobaculia bacterium]
MRALLTISYRGERYAGWQRQENALTVQEVVEEAVSKLVDSPIRVTGASRTDAGVHARGQAAHLDLPRPFPHRALVHGVNRHLPEDVRVMAAGLVDEGFHARKSALSKEYRYRLSRAEVLSPLDAPFAVQVPARIDPARMERAASLLVGRHDFSAFALAGGSHVQPFRRIFAAGWAEQGEELRFTITGDGFLRGMVRALVGTLIEVGLGRRGPEELSDLLSGRPRSEAGPTAPAHGLVLETVFYPSGLPPAGDVVVVP